MYLLKKVILSALLSITLITITPDAPLQVSGGQTTTTIRTNDNNNENFSTPASDINDKTNSKN